MFVPSSRNGILLKRMRENEEKLTDMTGFRVSYSEAGGTQLGRMFSTNLVVNTVAGWKTSAGLVMFRNQD